MSIKKTPLQIFIIPFIVFAIGLIGLIVALLFTGLVDSIAALGIAIPIAIIVTGMIKRAMVQKP